MEELVQYDPNMIVGILGGSAGTTYDAFKLIHDAQKYGARVALFGRKINHAEHQLAFIEMLRLITDGRVSPEEAVRAYHAVLQAKQIQPHRPLDKDLELTDQAMSYGGGSPRATVVVSGQSSRTPPPPEASSATRPDNQPSASPANRELSWPTLPNNKPDFERMSSTQRQAYDAARLKRVFG
jgi:hypothetical protein